MTPLGSRVVPEVKAISAGPAGSAAMVPGIGSALSRSSKLAELAPWRGVDGGSSPLGPAESRPTSPTTGTPAHRSAWYSSRPNRAAVTKTRGLIVSRMYPTSLRPQKWTIGTTTAPRNAEAQNTAAASIQLGSWNATRSPGPTPRARSPPASLRANRSTSRNVPDHGRTAECTRNAVSGAACRPPASRSPRVSRVHQPSASYRLTRSAGIVRMVRAPFCAIIEFSYDEKINSIHGARPWLPLGPDRPDHPRDGGRAHVRARRPDHLPIPLHLPGRAVPDRQGLRDAAQLLDVELPGYRRRADDDGEAGPRRPGLELDARSPGARRCHRGHPSGGGLLPAGDPRSAGGVRRR